MQHDQSKERPYSMLPARTCTVSWHSNWGHWSGAYCTPAFKPKPHLLKDSLLPVWRTVFG